MRITAVAVIILLLLAIIFVAENYIPQLELPLIDSPWFDKWYDVFLCAFGVLLLIATFTYGAYYQQRNKLGQRVLKLIIDKLNLPLQINKQFSQEERAFENSELFTSHNRTIQNETLSVYTKPNVVYQTSLSGEFSGNKIDIWEVKYNPSITQQWYLFIPGLLIFKMLWQQFASWNKPFNENYRFNGILIRAASPQPLPGRTLIFPREDTKFSELVERKVTDLLKQDYDLVRLESNDFNQSFTTYCSNQTDARYSLAPDIMQQIMDLKAQIKKPLYISLKDSQFYIAINLGESAFGLRLNKKINDYQRLLNLSSILLFCLDLSAALSKEAKVKTSPLTR